MPTSEDLGRLLQDIANIDVPDYRHATLPDARDDVITQLLTSFRALPEAERRRALWGITTMHTWPLIAFSFRMACLAVREKSVERIRDGLLAMVVEGFAFDARENYRVLALLDDAAHKTRADAKRLFDEAASYAAEPARTEMRAFVRRWRWDKSPKAMGFRSVEDPAGFRYEPA